MKLIRAWMKQLVTSPKTLLISLVSILAVATASWGYWWFSYPVIADVNYSQCQVSYGDVVASWDGGEESSDGSNDESDSEIWNQEGMHYQVRSFSLYGKADDINKPLTIEEEPTYIATGGEHACSSDIDETIDLLSDQYRYSGARAEYVRLGVPNLNQDITSSKSPKFIKKPSLLSRLNPFSIDIANTNLDLETPVYGDFADKAAVWVDDGGSVDIINEDESHQLWCINYLECGDITTQTDEGLPSKGAGYQFVSDNCPRSINCSTEWHSDFATTNILDVIRGHSFDLRLSAASVYAPYVGSETLLVFAYPQESSLDLEISTSSVEVSSGDELSIDIMLHKSGPTIKSLELVVDSDQQPLSIDERMSLDTNQLDSLNSEDRLSVNLSGVVDGSFLEDQCYILAISAKSDEVELGEGSIEYCIKSPSLVLTYNIATRGDTVADINEFAVLVAQTLGDSRGWSRSDVGFRRVDSGVSDFTIWLAAADQLTSFSTLCSAEYSCRVGRDVIINDVRWRNATPSWNEAGGNLRDYRHMVVNHEAGHLLGFGHLNCPTPGAPAPVMLQQSIDLQGCKFNPWPVDSEVAILLGRVG